MHDYGLIHPENLQTWASAQELSGTFMIDPSTLLGVPYISAWLGIVTIIKKDINNGYGLYIFNYHDSYCCMSNAGKWTEPWVKLTPNKYPSNPNLLDNWYFRRPVNQRGQMEYTGDAHCSIDRWFLQYDTHLNIVDGGVKLSGHWDIQQYFENTFPNATYTLSVLYKDKTGTDKLRLIPSNRQNGDINQMSSDDTSGLLSITVTTGALNKVAIGFSGSSDNSVTILAAKLELGDTQTLAHKEGGTWVLNEIPDFGDQLARCQRYCVKLGSSTGYEIVGTGTGRTSSICGIVVPIPVTMRAIPVAILSGQLILRNRDDANIVCTSVTVDVNGAGAMYLACTANDVTVGASYDAYLAPGNYLYLGADL